MLILPNLENGTKYTLSIKIKHKNFSSPGGGYIVEFGGKRVSQAYAAKDFSCTITALGSNQISFPDKDGTPQTVTLSNKECKLALLGNGLKGKHFTFSEISLIQN